MRYKHLGREGEMWPVEDQTSDINITFKSLKLAWVWCQN